MKTEEGIVIEVMGNTAKVKAGKHIECVECGACPGTEAAILTVGNKIGAKVGQRVRFEIVETSALKGAFMIFALPLIFAFFGAIAGGKMAETLNGDILTGRIVGGIVSFLISGGLIILFDRYVGKKKGSLPEIISIIQ